MLDKKKRRLESSLGRVLMGGGLRKAHLTELMRAGSHRWGVLRKLSIQQTFPEALAVHKASRCQASESAR